MSFSVMVDTGDQSIAWVSDSFAEHFRLPTSEFTGRPILALLESSPNEPWRQLFMGITSVDKRFHDVRIHRVGAATSIDEFELASARYVDAGRKVMISLRALRSRVGFDDGSTLAEVESRNAALLQGSPDGVIIHDGADVVYVNAGAARLIGCDPVDAVGMPIASLIDLAGSFGARGGELVDKGFDSRWVRLWLRRISGELVAVDASMALVSWSGAQAVQIVVHDWSLEPHRKESGAVREVVVEHAVSDAVISTDANLRIVDWNASATDMYGWSRDDVVGLSIADVLGPADPRLALSDSAESPSASDAWRVTVRHRHRDGRTLLVESAQTILRDSDGAVGGVLVVNRPADVGAVHVSTVQQGHTVSDPLESLDRLDPKPPGWREYAASVADVRDAIGAGEISVAYQPIVNLETGRLHHVEALARWTHTQRGVVDPDLFIPLAERSGVIDEMGEWVLHQACTDVLRMGAEGIDVELIVHLSVVQLREPQVAHRIADVLTNSGFPASRLWIEVEEGVLIDDRGLLPLHELHDLGAHLVIADFGTGHATFRYLTRVPIDALKIDTTFVSGLGVDMNDTAVVRSFVNLGHELGLEVVAEGITTEFQRAQLLALDCRLGQGRLFGHAVTLTELVASHRDVGARMSPESSAALTKRELEIVRGLVSGDRVPAIASRLFLSQSTVRNHLSSIYTKLGIRSQQQLVDRFRSTTLRPLSTPRVADHDEVVTRTAIVDEMDPEAALLRLAASHSLLRVGAVEEAVGICITLVRELGGWTIPSRLDDGRALPIDCSFGHGEPILPIADSPLARLRLERILPEVLDDARQAIGRIRRRDELAEQTRTDPLTGLMNRRATERVLSHLSPDDAVVVIDIDHFKSVNDRWGHAAGDIVLIAFSRTLRDRGRAGDHFARLGGDELLAVLVGTGEDGLTTFLERLHDTWTVSRPHEVTYSAGAAWVRDRSGAATLAAADRALGTAKDRGRDRVVIEPHTGPVARTQP